MAHTVTPVQLAHDRFGSLDRGVPVVLLHAFPFERSQWTPVAERLEAATVPVVTVDLPGLGDSPVPPSVPELEVSAAGVVGVLDTQGIERAVIAGVSMGGYVALALAARHPERVAGLALVDTKAEADDEQARGNRERMATAVLGEGGSRLLIPLLDGLLGSTSRQQRPEVVDRVRAALLAARPEGVAWSQRAMASRQDTTGLLPHLTVPVAVVVGEEDVLTPPSTARGTAAALPDAVLTVVPRAGHLTPVEAPDAVADALLALVLRVPGDGRLSSRPGAGSPLPG